MAIKNKQAVKENRGVGPNIMPPSMNNLVESMIGNMPSTAIQEGLVQLTEGGGVTIAGCEATPAGLSIPSDITPKALDDLIETLFSLDGVLPILIGDALNVAEDLKHGDITAIAEHFNRDAKTLWNWKSICKRVETSLRKEVWEDYRDKAPLSIGHYNLLQSMEHQEQEHWMRETYENAYSIARLAKAIKQAKGLLLENASPPAGDFASREHRTRMNRVWRVVASGDFENLKQDDIRLLRDWLNQLENQAGK